MASRRTSGAGGLSKKTGYFTDSQGKRTLYTDWQAGREVPVELLPRGLNRKQVTGNGQSRPEALVRLEDKWEAHVSGEAKRGKTRLAAKTTVNSLFEEWDRNDKAGAVSSTMVWKYERYFENHVLPHIGDRRLDSLREEDFLTLFNLTLAQKVDRSGRPLLQAKS